MKKTTIITVLLLLGITITATIFAFRSTILPTVFAPTPSSTKEGITAASVQRNQVSGRASNQENSQLNAETDNDISQAEVPADPIQTVATNLDIPWEISFLDDGSYLVTERPGNLVRIQPDSLQKIPISGVQHIGEGGLQGMALDPNFEQNSFLYLYLTTESESGLINRVERYQFNQEANTLSNKTIIIDAIPGARYHDGGRINFGPDGLLYIATGDATDESLAQDRNNLAGSILRIAADGSIPADNPFDNAVYSLGHRNVQGFTWDDQGRLWATEHGPSGIQSGQDEINLIEAGGNYGWPLIRGDQTQPELIAPKLQSGTEEVWAPAGAESIGTSLFFVGLRGVALYEAQISEDGQLSDLTAHFKNEFGRLRFVSQGPDGWLYLGTSNTDGRGTVSQDDDKIIKVHPSLFQE